MLGFITSWLSPTTLFLLLNLTIGTIAITTRFASNRNPHHQQPPHYDGDDRHQLRRAPSLIDRVKSINFSHFKFPSINPDIVDHHTTTESHYTSSPFVDRSQPPPIPIARVPSFLNRVRSINFSNYKFQSTNPETEFTESEHFNRVDSVNSSLTTLSRAPSLLDRVKSNLSNLHWSTSISSIHSIDSNPNSKSDSDEDSDLDHYEDNEIHVARSQLEKLTRGVGERDRLLLPEKMKKSASEKFGVSSRSTEDDDDVERRRPQTVSCGESGDVDAKADDFINKFKQQLKLQRVDSLLRYKEMMTRKGK